MVERGLLPDFSPAALAEAGAIPGARRPDPRVRDLRGLPLGFHRQRRLPRSRPALGRRAARRRRGEDPGGDRRRRRRWSRQGSAIDEHARTNTTSVYTAAADLPDAAGEALDRPDLARRGPGAPGDRHRDDGRRRRRGDRRPTSTARVVRNHAKLAYDSVAAWLDGTAPAPAAARGACRASTSSSASRTGRRRRCGTCATEHGALDPARRLEARAVLRRRRAHRPAPGARRTGPRS